MSYEAREALRGDGGGANQSPITTQGTPLKNARERMDVIAAYREVGSYRGAAAICGTTHKTVKRIIERHEAGSAARGSQRAPRATELRRGRRPGRGEGAEDVGADLGEAAAAGGPGGGLCGVGAELPPAGRRGEDGVAARQAPRGRPARRCGRPGETLVIDWGVAGRGCTCSARCWPGRGSGSCGSPTTRRPAPRWRCWPSASRSSAGSPRSCWPTGWAA